MKPSGYIQYLEKHQQEWNVANINSFPDKGYTLERKSVQEPKNVSYDEPYEGFSQSKLNFIQNDKYNSLTSNGCSPSKADELVITGTRVRGLKDHVDVKARRGTIASKTIEVQTDALSPTTEQEFASLTFPKSDILVEGHVNSAVTSSDKSSCTRTNSEHINSPIYASVDSTSLSHISEIVSPVVSNVSPSPVPQTANFIGEDQQMYNSNHVSDRTALTDKLQDENIPPQSHSVVSEGKVIEKIIGFNDIDDGNMEEEEVNIYLSELGGEYDCNFGPVNDQINSSMSGQNHNGNSCGGLSLSDELKNADFAGVVCHTLSPSSVNSCDGMSSSEALSLNHSPVSHPSDEQVSVSKDNDNQGMNKPGDPDIVADLGVWPKKTNNSTNVNNCVLSSMLKEKAEIEHLLDEKKVVNEVNTSTIYEQMMWNKMEIEAVLNDAIQNQQKETLDQLSKVNVSTDDSQHLNGSETTGIYHIAESNTNVSDLHTAPNNLSLISLPVMSNNDNYIKDSSLENLPVNSHMINSSPIPVNGDVSNLTSYIGVGARPKDPSVIRKNRPNTLHGLSKVDLDMPNATNIRSDVSSLKATTEGIKEGTQHLNSILKSSNHPELLNANLSELGQLQTESEAKQRMHNSDPNHPVNALPEEMGVTTTQRQPDGRMVSFPNGSNGSLDPSHHMMPEHAAQGGFVEDYTNSSIGHELDRTDSPSDVQKMIRPNILNLPARPDFALSHRDETDNSLHATQGIII